MHAHIDEVLFTQIRAYVNVQAACMNSHADRLLTYRLEKTWLFSVLYLALFLLGSTSPLLPQKITLFNIRF